MVAVSSVEALPPCYDVGGYEVSGSLPPLNKRVLHSSPEIATRPPRVPVNSLLGGKALLGFPSIYREGGVGDIHTIRDQMGGMYLPEPGNIDKFTVPSSIELLAQHLEILRIVCPEDPLIAKHGQAIANLIRTVLADDKSSSYDKGCAIKATPHANPSEIAGLRNLVTLWIRSVMADKTADTFDKRWAIKAIPHADPPEIANLIRTVLADDKSDYYDKVCAIEAIPHADPSEIAGLIRTVLADDKSSSCDKGCAIKAIPHANPSEIAGLRNLVTLWIRSVMADKTADTFDTEWAIEAIPYANPSDIADLVREAQAYDEIDVNWGNLPKKVNNLTRSILHDEATPSDVVKFDKTGTETFILPVAEDASVRIIPKQAAANWFKAFSDWPIWYEKGFNYVPVEDMLGVTDRLANPELDPSSQVAVTTSNLHGLNLWDYVFASGEGQGHIRELYAMRDLIKQTLAEMGIRHRHDHDKNFVVVPYTTDDGRADLSRTPRLYIIDFDMARSDRW